MNIIEATEKAVKTGKGIVNTKWSFKTHYLLPTNTEACYLVIPIDCSAKSKNNGKIGPRWNPRASDILSEDWELTGVIPESL